MKITDEMVEAAWIGWVNSLGKNPHDIPSAMRAALEAALCAKSGSAAEIIDDLMSLSHPMAESMPDGMRLTALIQIANKAAACIEDLAGALKKTNGRLYRLCECESESGCKDAALREENSATLERWGLK